MAILNPMTWDTDFFLLRRGNDKAANKMKRSKLALATVYISIISLSAFWLSQVTKYVPDPYLDEVFHIPQAQAYCRGEYGIWDPKLTTPPGLYFFSVFLAKLSNSQACESVVALRATNVLALGLLLAVAHGCRRYITWKTSQNLEKGGIGSEDSAAYWNDVHVAVNICLFPPIFFFSGLYYTDVLSTCIVIGAYEHFLQGGKGQYGSISRGLATYLIGVVALLMRQTNIFWVAVFMAGLEITRTFNGRRPIFQRSEEIRLTGQFNDFIIASYNGEYHDPKLADAVISDHIWCAASLGAAVLSNPKRVVGVLWPHIVLLISFAGFVIWNGGVVLGDKSNHVATIHLPQMLYIWPFITFFSSPLLYPSAFGLVVSLLPFSINWPENLFGTRRRLPMSTIIWLLAGVAVAVGVAHLNTIIHPFTLADNRHYVFYVFRYTIRRHPLVKYALTPFYIICAILVLNTLAGTSISHRSSTSSAEKLKAEGNTGSKQNISPGSLNQTSGPTCSFTIIWLLSTALSLITAPLVEPRYFIIPWVIWRLHVPPLPLSINRGPTKESKRQTKRRTEPATSCWAGWIKYWVYRGHDHRLWIESISFLSISLITGYIFLFKGFEWPQEPGRVQHFMW